MLRSLFVSALALTLLAAAQPAASPLVQAQLRGHWVCAQTGGPGGTYNEDWTMPFGGTWLRASDSVKGVSTGEHTITYSKATSTWIVLDAFPNGSYDVLHGTGSAAKKIAFHAVYPDKLSLAVTFTRLAATKYTVDVNGSVLGKQLRNHSVCTRH